MSDSEGDNWVGEITKKVKVFIYGWEIEQEIKITKSKNSKNRAKDIEVHKEKVEEEEKQSNSSKFLTETQEQKESWEESDAIFNSLLETIQPKYNFSEESQLYWVRGMSNLGNTWFFNSVMQCLNSIKDLYFMMNDKSNGWYGKGYPVNIQFRKYLTGMRRKDPSPLKPTGMLNVICRKYPRFGNGSQQDSHELLINLLDLLDSEATKKKKRSIVDKVFGGTFFFLFLCLTCKKISSTVQRFTDVILDLNFQQGHEKKNQQYNCKNNYRRRLTKKEKKKMKNRNKRHHKKQNKNKYFTKNDTWNNNLNAK